jgi:hypothetical protein
MVEMLYAPRGLVREGWGVLTPIVRFRGGLGER